MVNRTPDTVFGVFARCLAALLSVVLVSASLLALTAPAALAADTAIATTAATGSIRGRASLGGVLVEEIEIRAYAHRSGSFGPLTGEPVAGRAQTATDGTYRIELPPGRYVVEGLKKMGANTADKPEAGDLYCLYSGSPITVAVGQSTTVGLYLVEVAPQTRSAAKRSAITGKLTFQGEKVEKTYLYAYKSPMGEFRGPADLLQPVAKGDFTVRLPPGTYYLVARKRRTSGGPYGPIAIGDLFNFYPLNPVILKKGEQLSIELPLIERLSQLEEGEGDYRGLTVLVVDPSGKPLAGRYVLAYGEPGRTGPPAASAGPTGAEGTVVLNAPPSARYLRVRQNLGGPVEEGEAVGDGELPTSPATGEKQQNFTVTIK
jgi:hypothetical protein